MSKLDVDARCGSPSIPGRSAGGGRGAAPQARGRRSASPSGDRAPRWTGIAQALGELVGPLDGDPPGAPRAPAPGSPGRRSDLRSRPPRWRAARRRSRSASSRRAAARRASSADALAAVVRADSSPARVRAPAHRPPRCWPAPSRGARRRTVPRGPAGRAVPPPSARSAARAAAPRAHAGPSPARLSASPSASSKQQHHLGVVRARPPRAARARSRLEPPPRSPYLRRGAVAGAPEA